MEEIENKIQEIDAIKENIANFEVNPDDYTDQYDEMLDEVYPNFMGSYSASYTLKCVDEIAYRCGLLDYVDSLEITPPDEWDIELSDLLQELEEMIDDKSDELYSMIEELEEELENGADVQSDIDALIWQGEELERLRKEYL